MIRKTFDLTIEKKELSASGAGSFQGAASVYNVIDLHGDVIVPGAFDATLKQKGAVRPLLWQHRMDDPIGTSKFVDSESALLVDEGVLVEGVRQAEEAGKLVDAGAVTGLSIGFDIVRDSWDGGVRIIEEIDLWEVSLVTFPANPLARIAKMADAAAVLEDLRAKHVKAGRVLSAKNLDLVVSAYDALGKLIEAAKAEDDTKGSGSNDPDRGIQPTTVLSEDDATAFVSMMDEIRKLGGA